MKRIIYTLALVATSCGPDKIITEKKENEYGDQPLKEIFSEVNYQEVTIDSCDYIIGRDEYAYNGGYFLTHKGNCKNSVHK